MLMKIPRRLIENDIDLVDVDILNRLTDPKFFKRFEKQIARDIAMACNLSADEAKRRIENLKKKKVIDGYGALVDRLKVWDNMIFTFTKIALAPPLIEVGLAEQYPSTWVAIGEVLRQFIAEDDIAKKILREAYTLIGSEWDLLIITVTNDLGEHREMFERLSKRGYISGATSMFPIQGAPYIYRPSSVPLLKEVKQAVSELRQYVDRD